jgi:hypothetical protein
MIAIQGYYEHDRVQLLEPVPYVARAKGKARVAVLFLDTYDVMPAVAQHESRSWTDDSDSQEQAMLLRTIHEELTPYLAEALKTAADEDEEDSDVHYLH